MSYRRGNILFDCMGAGLMIAALVFCIPLIFVLLACLPAIALIALFIFCAIENEKKGF